MSNECMTLYRAVGQAEFDFIRDSGFRAFPPRLPEQPFFYPVLSQDYASKIAREWNSKDARSGLAGYVLRFNVRVSYLQNYEVHTVGSSDHREYWIPAPNLGLLNENIAGAIEVVAEYRGKL